MARVGFLRRIEPAPLPQGVADLVNVPILQLIHPISKDASLYLEIRPGLPVPVQNYFNFECYPRPVFFAFLLR